MSDFLKNEVKNIRAAVDGPQGDIKGSITLGSWRHPSDAINSFSVSGGTDQGQIADMADVVENMANNPNDFMKQTFPIAHKEYTQKKAEKQYNTYKRKG